MMEQEYYNIESPLFLFNEEIELMKSSRHRNYVAELINTMTDSDLMNMILDKKSEELEFNKKLIFKLEFELRIRREDQYGSTWWRKSFEQMKQELEEKKKMISIVDVIQSMTRMNINWTNKNYRCPLPDHRKDNTPSFHIYPHTWTFKCFWCGKWGSVIDFIMYHEQVDVAKAIALFLSM